MDGMNSSNQLSSTIEFFMTSEQQRVISELLPKGYSLQFASKPARQKSNNFALFSPLDGVKQQTIYDLGRNSSQILTFKKQSESQMRSQNVQFSTNSKGQRQSKQTNSGKSCDNLENFFESDAAKQETSNLLQQQQFQNPQLIQYQQEDTQQQGILQQQQSQFMGQQQQFQQMQFPQPKLQQRKSNSHKAQLNGLSSQQFMPAMSQPKRRTSDKPQKRRSDGSNKSEKGYSGDSLFGLGMEVEEQKKCLSVLTALQRHKMAVPFLRPVDPIKQECGDYFMVIRDPMDLGTVERNLRSLQYQSPTQFAADIRKIWNNSYLYNSRDSQIYQMTLEMERFFEQKFRETEHSNVFRSKEVKNIPYLVQMLAQAMQGKTNGSLNNNYAPPQRAPAPSKKPKSAPSKMDIPMTMQEKKNLGQNILQLPPDYLRGIWEIVQSDSDQRFDDKVMEFDIDALSVRKTRELEQYVKQKMANISKKLSKQQRKLSDKAENAESKLFQQQQVFCNDDETSATRNETSIVQDQAYPELTQSTATHTQQYHNQMNANFLGMDSTNNGGYSTGNLTTEYAQTSNGILGTTATDQVHYSLQNTNGQGGAGAPNEPNDQDSESSFMSGDSDSQNY